MVHVDMEAHKDWTNEPVAIIGLSSKFAGPASSTREFWRTLLNGEDGWTPFPASRFRPEGVFHPDNQRLNSTHVKGAHFIEEDVGLFDAAFFGYSGETAASTDPQYRLQLESAYEALENAGLSLAKIAGSNTSVYTGVFVHDYRDGLLRDADNLPRLMATGTGVPMMSNRISHFFDLRGPSMTIETACSSGMVSTAQGVSSLRSGESDLSIVGGANLCLNPDMFKALGSAGFLSADGRSYAFDSRASGYGRGEGVGTLVLKRLSDALADGDPIRAVIRETLLNQDGKTETITTPSLEAQEALLRGCYLKANIDPKDTQYFEAHGTGTQAGDTVEAKAIAKVFGAKQVPLLIGSAKTNFGHTEAASGLASIIKTVLALEHGVIPPSINFEKPNPKIPLEEWNLKLVRKVENWPETSHHRRASINNFGYGGANAHIIIEDAASWTKELASNREKLTNGLTNGHIDDLAKPLVNGNNAVHLNGYAAERRNGYPERSVNGHLSKHELGELKPLQLVEHPSNNSTKVFIFSGKDEAACQKSISNHVAYLTEQTSAGSNTKTLLDSLAYTLGERRTRFSWSAAHTLDITEDIEKIVRVLESPKFKPSRSSRKPRIGFVFSGQGAQWHAMGRELVDAYPVYKDSLLEAEEYLKQFGADWSMLEELSRDADVSRINEVALSTPICVAVQISLVRLLRSWSIEPVAVTSHSSGEIAAAYAAGALSYKASLATSFYRALSAADKSLRGPVQGAMIAVGLGLQETEAYIKRLKSDSEVMVACVNSPSSITVSGDLPAILELEKLANEEGVFARRLRVDVAWHSHQMAPIARAYSEVLGQKQRKEGQADGLNDIAFSSPVTGDRVKSAVQIASPDHWVKSLLQPVQFVDAFTDMVLGERGSAAANVDLVVEVGPHTALGGPVQQILALPQFSEVKLPYFGTLVRKTDARESMQALAGNLLLQGYPVDLGPVNFPRGKGESVKVLTNLPSYPWNHQVRHWIEPRFNRALRERSVPAHDLLGSLVEGSPNSPSWRHTLRISESPWTRDHAIQSNVVYPAAGYVCLAIEAIRQLTITDQATNSKPITGYHLKDVDFLQALMIPDDSDGIEIQTALRPTSNSEVSSKGYRQFEVWTVTADNRWTQHAQGLITVELEGSSAGIGPSRSSAKTIKGFSRRLIPNDLFSNLRALGIQHGPIFQNMRRIDQSGLENRSIVTMSIADTSVANDIARDHVLHPVTLDGIITSPYASIPGAAAREMAAKVPRSVGSLWVSSKISHDAGHLFKNDSIITLNDSQGLTADVVVSDEGSDQVVLEMKSFSYQSLGKSLTLADNEPWKTELYSKIDWALDISFLTPATVQHLQDRSSFDEASITASRKSTIQRVCIYLMQEAISSLGHDRPSPSDSHLIKYHAWVEDQLQQAASSQLAKDSAKWLEESAPIRQQQINELAESSVYGRQIRTVGDRLADLLRGPISAAEVLGQDDYVPDNEQTQKQLLGLLKHLIHKNPRARILEIAAGKGTTTRAVLDVLGNRESGGPQASVYHFTDPSIDLCDTARDNLSSFGNLMAFDRLDINYDPIEQGFSGESYDIVIASYFVHNIKAVSRSLSNIQRLLKPRGTLIIAEDVQPRTDIQLLRGLSPTWWSCEEPEREHNALLSVDEWDKKLQASGFSIDVTLASQDEDGIPTAVALMISRQAPIVETAAVSGKDIVIITSKKAGAPPVSWLQSLQDAIASGTNGKAGEIPPVVDLESALATDELFTDKICIFIGEIENAILYELDSASLAGIRAISTSSRGLLWVTSGGAVDCDRPELGLAVGFVRSLRCEYIGRKLLTLDLDPSGLLWSSNGVTAIVHVLQNAFGQSADSAKIDRTPTDSEFAERNGTILVPRLVHDVTRNKNLSDALADQADLTNTIQEPLYQQDRPLCLKPGSFAFDDDPQADAYKDALPPKLVEVEPKAFGANFRASDEHLSGLECAGVVVQAGSEAVAEGYIIGDRVVCLLSKSSFPSRAFVEWTAAAHISATLSFQDAVSLPSTVLPAYISIVEVANLKSDQTILIHRAETAIGQAAIMLAKNLNAEVFATVENAEKRELIAHKYNINVSHIFSSRDKTFGPAILSATKGSGVEVVLNALSDPILLESFEVVAPLGRLINIGTRVLTEDSSLDMRLFTRSVTFSTVDLPSLLEHRGLYVHRCLREVISLTEQKVVKPVHPLTSYAIGDVVEASHLLQSEVHEGPVVLTVGVDELVPVVPKSPKARLSSTATYVIVGGSGGLGQSVGHWLVSRGARNLALLSRTAATSHKTAAFAQELLESGCLRVLPISCDVADEDDLAQAIGTCASEGLPPIRGVIHSAFVLQDSFVEKMTVEDFKKTTSSKVAGVYNIHNQFNLEDDLDFFILFSSINGVLGYASQAAYSAAGAYEDAFAHWRVKHCGLPAVSIDLSVVNAVGYVAEADAAETLRKSLIKAGRRVIDEDIVLASLESAILSPCDPQFIVGGINTNAGPHWDVDGELGRDMRTLGLKYRPTSASEKDEGSQVESDSLAAKMAACETSEEAVQVVGTSMAEMLGDMFLVPAEEIDLSESPSKQGVDSLVAVEVRNMLFSQAAADLSIFSIMQSPSLAALASDVVDRSTHVSFVAAAA